MNLNFFIKEIITHPNHAVKIMDTLIDMLDSNTINEKAILTFFNDIPKDVLKEKEVTEIIFTQFFNKYKINDNNIQYYDKYINTNYHKQNIIANNPDWEFKETVFEYNTLKELLGNFQSACYQRRQQMGYNLSWENEDGLIFIEKNTASFTKFSKMNKNFLKLLIKNNFFKFLLNIGYNTYKKFCDQYNVKHLDIIHEMFIKPYSDTYDGYGFAEFMTNAQNDKIPVEETEKLLQEICVDKEKFFGQNNQFLVQKNRLFDARYHVSAIFIEFIVKNDLAYANILKKYFNEEIIEGVINWSSMDTKNKLPTEMNHEMLTLALQRLKNFGRGNGSFHVFEYIDVNVIDNYIQKDSNVSHNKKLKV